MDDLLGPRELWYLHDSREGWYGGINVDDKWIYPEPVQCMACFLNQAEAMMFRNRIHESLPSLSAKLKPYRASFDEIREIAKLCNKGFVALAVLTETASPKLHFLC